MLNKETKAFTLIEIIIAISLLVVFSAIIIIYFRESQEEIEISTVKEEIYNKTTYLKTNFLNNKYQKLTFNFKEDNPLLYYYNIKYITPQSLTDYFPKNLKIDENSGGLIEASKNQNGFIALTWEKALFDYQGDKKVSFVSLAGEKIKQNLITDQNSLQLTELNDNNHYKFSLYDKNKKYLLEEINLFYLHIRNLRKIQKNLIKISKIEVQDFNGDFIPIASNKTLKIIYYQGKVNPVYQVDNDFFKKAKIYIKVNSYQDTIIL
jgi:prepilin-type N-terminal cleavage/methylation domain-containing protein